MVTRRVSKDFAKDLWRHSSQKERNACSMDSVHWAILKIRPRDPWRDAAFASGLFEERWIQRPMVAILKRIKTFCLLFIDISITESVLVQCTTNIYLVFIAIPSIRIVRHPNSSCSHLVKGISIEINWKQKTSASDRLFHQLKDRRRCIRMHQESQRCLGREYLVEMLWIEGV